MIKFRRDTFRFLDLDSHIDVVDVRSGQVIVKIGPRKNRFSNT